MQVDTTEPALFRSAQDALRFAYNFQHGQYEPSALASMMAGKKPAGRGLGGLDGAAQAGMIKSEIDRLVPRVRSQILIARFARREWPCACGHPCCRGYRPNVEWVSATSDIAAEVLRAGLLAGTTVNFTLRHAIVWRHFGARISFLEAARQADVNRDTASLHSGRIIEYLRDQEQRARYAIEAALKETGMIE